jgi:hypothetical protein
VKGSVECPEEAGRVPEVLGAGVVVVVCLAGLEDVEGPVPLEGFGVGVVVEGVVAGGVWL